MTVDPRSDRAIYRQIADVLRAQIAEGALQPGQMLPSEKHLADTYDVGRDAVRQAITILRNEGLVTTLKGRGTVIRGPLQRKQVILADGMVAVARMPTDDERLRLGMEEGVPVICVGPKGGDSRVYPADAVYLTRDNLS